MLSVSKNYTLSPLIRKEKEVPAIEILAISSFQYGEHNESKFSNLMGLCADEPHNHTFTSSL